MSAPVSSFTLSLSPSLIFLRVFIPRLPFDSILVPYLRDGWPEPFSARIPRKLMPSSFRGGSRSRRFIILPSPLPPPSPMVGGWHAGSRFSTTEAILYKNSRRGSRYSKFGRKLNGTGGSPVPPISPTNIRSDGRVTNRVTLRSPPNDRNSRWSRVFLFPSPRQVARPVTYNYTK